ncbi:MAG: response regulator [Patescibacteria group bacterium]|nr:response regulator [Patescibacteria group bacterium]
MAQNLSSRSVLLVDDDAFLLDLYARKFQQSGFSVVKADTADEALGKLRDGLSPEAVVFDIVMPHIDGYEFLEIMNKERLAPSAVKIALSNQTSEEDVKRAKSLGAQACIGKASAIPSETVEQVLAIMNNRSSSL